MKLGLVQAGVDHPEKGRRPGGCAWKHILDCSVARVELSRKVVLVDVIIMWWKVIALEAKRADPYFRLEINATKGIEN